MDDIELGSRAIYPAGWGLLGQWFCIKADATQEEQHAAAAQCRDSLGPDFAQCPDEWIADRFYGGFKCADDPTRVHVYFCTGQYSYIEAGEGHFWANDTESRSGTWSELFDHNQGWQQSGPWTQDAPSVTPHSTVA